MGCIDFRGRNPGRAGQEKSFNVNVTFRQMLEELNTVSALATHIEACHGTGLGKRTSEEDSGSDARAEAGIAARMSAISGARLGRDAAGNEAWFVPDPNRPGKYLQVTNT